MTSVPPPRLPRLRSPRRRRLSRSTALFTLVGGCALLAGGPASASGTGALSPYLDCVTTNPQTGDVTAYYGYHNTTGTALTINVGENNQTFPVDAFQGQPTYFNQGTFAQAFTVTFDPKLFPSIAWILNGQEADASAASAACTGGVTTPATAVGLTGATLTGVVVPTGTGTGYSFSYGTTPALGTTTPVQDFGTGTQPLLVQQNLTGLFPGTTYYVRLDTTSDAVTTHGQVLSFTTTPTAPLVITTATLAAGAVHAHYAVTLACSGGLKPYTWTITAGRLPAGLTLNPTTGAITGTPTAKGTSTFTVKLSSAGAPRAVPVSRQYHLTIAAAKAN
nr:putative Ig domain-containing protein [Streptomyces sp. 846.5]